MCANYPSLKLFTIYKFCMFSTCSSSEHLLVNIPNESIKKINNEVCKKFRERGVLISTRGPGCGLGEPFKGIAWGGGGVG